MLIVQMFRKYKKYWFLSLVELLFLGYYSMILSIKNLIDNLTLVEETSIENSYALTPDAEPWWSEISESCY